MSRLVSTVLSASVFVLCAAPLAAAQPLGTFSWQLQPYCNRLTLNVTQQSGIFTLDGFDDQCGAATRASATGIAFQNPNGTIGLGLVVVLTPGAGPVHIDATVSLPSASGTWRDNTGHAGTFAFGVSGGGPPRPVLSGVSGLQFNIGDQPVLSARGIDNLVVGVGAGAGTIGGSDNTFVGADAGTFSSGSNNTFVGSNARGAAGIANATAIGADAQVTASDSLVLGSIAGVNGAVASTRVGIGTISPDAPLEVVSSDGILATGYGISSAIAVRRARGTEAAPLAIQSGDRLGFFGARGHDGASFSFTQAAVVFDATETYTAAGKGTQIEFLTTANGSAGAATRMTIDHDGEVGIGTTVPLNLLHVNGDVRIGACVYSAAGPTVSCASDARFKKEIRPLPALLDRVASLAPVRYSWRADEFPERSFGEGEAVGLVAQDVERALPELVTTDADGYKAVDYGTLPLLAIQAIRELKEKNDTLERRLAAIEASLSMRR